ncbi:hypothetical protein [Marinilabilia rubra]|jgi:hypothetical protein|uniref:Uncharacterized protein n=1 Tax=Marinilabilia rubra TaxID=2162893 RepID=A0A2U2B6X1_9BACT|nr:hypothetical protein [Marinilabilia rubra]PWD98807.1 hypothetical protein DDZ16_13795 [Marinilabilia rubra]
MDVILQERIKEKVYELENIKTHVTVPMVLMINSPREIHDIGNAFYFLTGKNLNDIDQVARLRLRSSDNTFTTSPIEYGNLELSRYAAFRDYLEITLENYLSFRPFKLEFLKVQPIYHDHD